MKASLDLTHKKPMLRLRVQRTCLLELNPGPNMIIKLRRDSVPPAIRSSREIINNWLPLRSVGSIVLSVRWSGASSHLQGAQIPHI